MASRITIDEARGRLAKTKMVRSLQVDLLLTILKSIRDHESIGYATLYKEVVRASPKQPSNSTYYHMLVAGHILGLLHQKSPRQPYVLTKAGEDLLAASQEISHDVMTDSGFREQLADIVRKNPTIDHAFFWLFRGLDNSVSLEHGQAIYIEPISPERNSDNKRRQRQWVRSEFCEPIVLDTVLTQSIVFGLRQWCLDLGILDELVVAQSPDIDRDRVQVLFPIQDFDRAIEVRSFEERLLPHFWGLARRSANCWFIGVPELLHRLCPAENLGVETVKVALAKWIAINRRYIAISVFAPSVPMSAWQRKTGAYDIMQRSYLYLDAEYVSGIGLLEDALTDGVFTRTQPHFRH